MVINGSTIVISGSIAPVGSYYTAIYYSTNGGSSFTQATLSGISTSFGSITSRPLYFNSTYYVWTSGGSPYIFSRLSSPDGITWTKTNTTGAKPNGTTPIWIARNPSTGIICAFVPNTGTTNGAYSSDGLAWTQITGISNVESAYFNGTNFLAGNSANTTTRYTSSDGSNWVTTTIPVTSNLLYNRFSIATEINDNNLLTDTLVVS
jgi:hypothetical protein